MVSKEDKKHLDNVKYMGGTCPIHVSVYVEQNLARIDFIMPAFEPSEVQYTSSAGVNVYAHVKKEYLVDIIKGLQKAYETLK